MTAYNTTDFDPPAPVAYVVLRNQETDAEWSGYEAEHHKLTISLLTLGNVGRSNSAPTQNVGAREITQPVSPPRPSPRNAPAATGE